MHDFEGRTITCHFQTFILVVSYVPNSGIPGLHRLEYRVNSWDKDFHNFLKEELENEHKKPVILAGDLNVAHHEIDIHRALGHEGQAGFTREERESRWCLSGVIRHGRYVQTFQPQEEVVQLLELKEWSPR